MKRIIVIVAAAMALSCARDPRVTILGDGWTYAHARSGPWAEEIERDPARDLWLRCPLPASKDAELVFRAYVGTFEVYGDGTRLYAFDDPHAQERITVHHVPLGGARELLVHVSHPGIGPIFGGSPFLAPRAAVPYALVAAVTDPLRADVADIAAGFVLLVIGIAAVAISRLRRRGDASALLWFGVFAALYGLRLVTDSALPRTFGAPWTLFVYVTAFITYVITVPAWLLASRLLGDGWRSTLRWQVLAFALFAPIGIASDLLRHRPGSLESANNVLVILGGINILLNLVAGRHWRAPGLRVVFAGATLFMLFALNNNLVALGALPWAQGDETIGFLVFVSALGYASMRSFVRGERERVALEGELATAREIQRSILPAEMPRIARLRVTARYDPASSVAGDLYDFLPLDDFRLGVLVADVSGHGVPAALIASMVKIAVSSNAANAHDPAAMLTQLGGALRRDVRRTFVTATYLYFDTSQNRVLVANAGHPSPLLLRDGTFTDLGHPGIVLGRFGASTYSAQTTELRAGDRIVAFTDGIVEARNARGDAFGEERMQEIVRNAANPADEVIAAVHRWRGRADEDADDLTIVVIDYGNA